MIVLLLLVTGLGAILLGTKWAESSASVPAPSGQVAELSTASTAADALPSMSTTTASTREPTVTDVVLPTVSSTATAPTLPEPSATLAPSATPPEPSPTAQPAPTAAPSPTPPPSSPTLAPSPTVLVATLAPTQVPPTVTPAISISVVTSPNAFVYDGPSFENSIIGGVEGGDELVVLGSNAGWYLVRVNGPGSPRSRIEGGQGWIDQGLISPPSQPIPAVTP